MNRLHTTEVFLIDSDLSEMGITGGLDKKSLTLDLEKVSYVRQDMDGDTLVFLDGKSLVITDDYWEFVRLWENYHQSKIMQGVR